MNAYTKRVNLTQSPLFRKYGAKGMRRFYIVWGTIMYLLLISISFRGLYALMQIIDEPGPRVLLFVAVALIVVAASLLTRMLIGIFSELRALESQRKTGDGGRSL
jgi:hypothetical protein